MKIPRSIQLEDFATFHLCWKCSDSDNLHLLSDESIKDLLLPTLSRYKEACGVKVYDFCVMDNHVHLVLAISTVARFLRFLHRAHTSFAKQVNNALKRSGQLIKDRAKITIIGDTKGMLFCQSYIALNRWACNLRVLPANYKHCGYAHYALGQKNPHLDTSPSWLELGETDEARQQAYKEFVAARMEAKEEQKTADMIALLDGKLAYYGQPAYMEERTTRLKEALATYKDEQKQPRAAKDAAEQEELQRACAHQAAFAGAGCEKR